MEDCQLLGEYLREQRLLKGFSLQDISLRTKIRMSYLQALEDGCYEQLPADTYIKGFLGSYAELLDLPNEKLIEWYSAERPPRPSPVLRPASSRVASTRKNQRSVLPFFLALLALFCGLAGWWFWSQVDSAGPVGVAGVDRSETEAAEASETIAEMKGADSPAEEDNDSAKALARDVEVEPSPVSPDLRQNEQITGLATRPPEQGDHLASVLPAVLELQAVHPAVVTITIDGRDQQTYSLQPESLLRWRIRSSLQLQSAPADAVRLYLNDLEVKPDGNGHLSFPRSE
ncbi:MAG: helix-turn-helix domain-containing protein [Desulfuromonadales bacterium]|nr:helix-turn-helix domain-containing protein [Desulfuromonadales bacterium]